MYERYSRKVGWDFDVLDAREGGRRGALRMAVCEIKGAGADKLHQEAGAHSIQHITRSRNKDRIHTSNASIAVFDAADLRARAKRSLAAGEVRIDTFRGSGAGGQHRNVTDSAVRALHVPTGEMVTVTSGRSQGDNREQALAVLMSRLVKRADGEHHEAIQQKRAKQARAGRAQTTRVYDLIRDMVRCERTGQKVRRVRKVLDGDLSAFLG